jgi:hypothetical protein
VGGDNVDHDRGIRPHLDLGDLHPGRFVHRNSGGWCYRLSDRGTAVQLERIADPERDERQLVRIAGTNLVVGSTALASGSCSVTNHGGSLNMRWFIVVGLLLLAPSAFAASHSLTVTVSGASTCPDDDGSGGASAGAPQSPRSMR